MIFENFPLMPLIKEIRDLGQLSSGQAIANRQETATLDPGTHNEPPAMQCFDSKRNVHLFDVSKQICHPYNT